MLSCSLSLSLWGGGARLTPSPSGGGLGWGHRALASALRLLRGRSREFAPAGESLSFASPKESNQRKGDPTGRVPPLRYGSLRCSLFAGSAQTRFAQTRAALIREKLRSSATARGELEFNAPWRVLVWEGPVRALRVLAHAAYAHAHAHAQALFQASRSEAVGRRAQRWPVPPPLCACRGAQLQAEKGPRVFERSEFARTPPEASTAGCPGAERRGHAQWGRLSLVTFFGETKKVTHPPGRHPGSSFGTSAKTHQVPGAPTPALPQRGREQGRSAFGWPIGAHADCTFAR